MVVDAFVFVVAVVSGVVWGRRWLLKEVIIDFAIVGAIVLVMAVVLVVACVACVQ